MSKYDESKALAYADGELVSTIGADRGEAAELAAILEEYGVGADYLEREIERRAQEKLGNALKQMLADLVFPPPRSTIPQEVAVLAYSIGFPGLPRMSHASSHFKLGGMSKQVLSIRCKKKIAELGLRPSSYMKSLAASQKYAKSNKRKT